MSALAMLPCVRKLRRAIDTGRRVVMRETHCPELARLHLAVRPGEVLLFGRDHHRAHLVTLPAETDGEAELSLTPGAAVRLRRCGGSGPALLAAEDGAVTLEAGAYAVTVPAMSAPFLRLPDTPSCSGVVVSRAKLEGALAGDEDPAVALRTADGVLLVNGAPVAMTYHAGAAFTALLGRRLLLDAVKGGDGAELSLELAGPEMPIRVECGFLLALIAQRRSEALLAARG